MKKTIVLIAALALTACTTNGQIDYGKTALLAVGVVAVGVAISQSDSNSNASGSNCHWVVTANGSTQVCR